MEVNNKTFYNKKTQKLFKKVLKVNKFEKLILNFFNKNNY